MNPRYLHTNIIAADAEGLAQFYQDVLGCVPVPPGRDLTGRWLDRVTGIPQARIRGLHLRLPGYGPDPPILYSATRRLCRVYCAIQTATRRPPCEEALSAPQR